MKGFALVRILGLINVLVPI